MQVTDITWVLELSEPMCSCSQKSLIQFAVARCVEAMQFSKSYIYIQGNFFCRLLPHDFSFCLHRGMMLLTVTFRIYNLYVPI